MVFVHYYVSGYEAKIFGGAVVYMLKKCDVLFNEYIRKTLKIFLLQMLPSTVADANKTTGGVRIS